MAYFDCQIVQGGGGMILTVTCDPVYAGTTITATDGEITLTATCPSSSPYTVEFKIPNSGSWTISGTYSGDTQTITVIIPDSATLTQPIPTGATVTPINDVQIWMHCANVWDKNYTTISQVLADTSLVTTLIASNNAADYMARSTSWANSVTANASAMTKIGANDYCANKLLANSTWRNAICNSTYFESVLNVKVPTMTSNTTPYGIAGASSAAYGADAYRVFDGDNTMPGSSWTPSNNAQNNRLYYIFSNPACIKRIDLYYIYAQSLGDLSFKVQVSDDGTTWNDVANSDFTISFVDTTSKKLSLNIENDDYHLNWAIFTPNKLYVSGSGQLYVTGLQFYGRSQS